MTFMSLREIKKSFGNLEVLKNVNFDIEDGERIGLVGNNGAGKTTLVNILMGVLQPDGGSILRSRQEIGKGYLLQSASYPEDRLTGMFLRENDNRDVSDFLEVAGQLGLQKVQDWETERFNGLSGGEKTKLALADILVTKPELLVMDEPTNHMDFKGIEWLIGELSRYKGTILIISHDRYFLDRTVNRIIELEDGAVVDYPGNYTFYREEKARRYESQLHQYMEQKKRQQKIEEEIDRLKEWSDKAHRNAGKSDPRRMGLKEFERKKAKKMDIQVKSRIKRLERIEIEGVKKPKEEQRILFDFEGVENRGKRLIEAKQLRKGYGSRTLFADSSFYILKGDRVGLIGPNGCGKTTMIRMLLGHESVDEGELWVSPSAEIAYLSQDVTDLQRDMTVMDLLKGYNFEQMGKARTLFSNLGFDEGMLTRPVGCLSLGERTRVKLARILLQEQDLLMLDEPTNHLDLHSRERLEETLKDYAGTLLVVSHDRYMLERICDKLLVFENGKITLMTGTFEQYMMNKTEEGKGGEKKKVSANESRMVIENRIASVLGELSRLTAEDPRYAVLDTEFKELVRQKNALK